MTQSGHSKDRTGCPFAVPYNYFFPGGLYKLATLDALSATALNSAPVQALEVVTSEIVPAAAVAKSTILQTFADRQSSQKISRGCRQNDGDEDDC